MTAQRRGEAPIRRAHAGVLPCVDGAPEFGEAIGLRGADVGAMVSRADRAGTRVDIWFLHVYRTQPDGSLRSWRGSDRPNPYEQPPQPEHGATP